MTRQSTAADMLTRMPRAKAVERATYIAEMHAGQADCAAYWRGVAAILEGSNDVEPSAPAEEDVFSFSATVKARMGRSG
jgi:hypothetical protein